MGEFYCHTHLVESLTGCACIAAIGESRNFAFGRKAVLPNL
jgi:hypothetical protein